MEMLEFVIPALNIKAILPHIILTITALTVLLVDVFSMEGKKSHLGLMSLVGVGVAGACLLYTKGMSESAYSGMILIDGFSFFISLIICVVTFLTILISINYQKFFEEINCGEYYCLLLFAAVGMMLMGSAGNFLMIFLALETMSISIRSIEAALKYFLLGAFASGFLLYGFALIYGATGTMDIIRISRLILDTPELMGSRLLLGGLALTTVGFGFKVAMVPFHMWTPDVYEGAPTSVTAFMATGVKAAAFAVFVRVFYVAFAPLQVDWSVPIWIIAILTMTVGNVVALSQTNIKRMLAYSSIAHAGYLLVGFLAGEDFGKSGMLFYLLAYAFMNLGAFGVIALLGKKDTEYSELSDFSGLGFKYPLMGVVMAVFMFSMAGIPPTAGFMGKFYIFTAAIKSGFIWLSIFGVINSVISIFYYLRVIVIMYFQESGEQDIIMPTPSPAIIVALTLAAAGVLLMGIIPSYFWNLAQQSSKIFM